MKQPMLGILVAGLAVMACGTRRATAQQTGDVSSQITSLKESMTLLENKIATLESRQQTRKVIEEILAEGDFGRDMPSWIENLTFYGDLRLRYEYRRRAESTGGRRDDEGRARYRLRAGIKKQWPDDGLEVGFRLASGDGGGPTSTNETMNDFFARDQFMIDRAYAIWKPKAVKGLMVTGGKIKQPWVTTDLVWDSDLNPEGVWVQYDVPVGQTFVPFVGTGAFFLSNVNPGDDTNMNAYAAGFNWTIDGVKWTSAVTYYETSHYSAGLTVPGEEWDYLNITNKFKFKAAGLALAPYVDYVHSCGTNADTPDDRDDGYAFGIKVGENKKKGDWAAKYAWKYLQLEASPRAFNDGDFPDGHKGHVFGVKYNVTKAMQVGLSLYYSEPIYNTNADGERVTLHADMIWTF